MATDFDVDSVRISQVLEGIAAMVAAPVILPVSSAMKQPLVKSAIREGIAFSERCQEAVALAQENIEDMFAEIQTEVDADYERQQAPNAGASGMQPMGRHRERSRYWDEKYDATQTAVQIQDMMYELNTQISWLSRGTLDLRMLMTMGLGAIALRQLIVRGVRLDEIPWYVFAWYALDTFVKFHPGIFSPGEEPEPNPIITVEPSPESSP